MRFIRPLGFFVHPEIRNIRGGQRLLSRQKLRGRKDSGQFSPVEQCDPRGKQQRFAYVVSHHHNRFSQTPLKLLELLEQFAGCERIERSEWLVHQQNRRVHSQCSRDTYALALPSGELVRISFRKCIGIEPNAAQELLDARANSLYRPLSEPRNQGDVLLDREMWKQADILYDVTDMPA